jgi:sulfhydrogenase subunit beta (sulfur reductase)
MTPPVAVLDREHLDDLFAALKARGYRVLGPTVRSGAIVHRALESSRDLPEGWHDEQAPGAYRIHDDGDAELFGWAVGPTSLKDSVFPAHSVVWRGRRRGGDVEITTPEAGDVGRAFVGVRPCEVAALAVLSKVLSGGSYHDSEHDRRRRQMVVIVAECGHPASTCFCPSMGTGPGADVGYDLALTELLQPQHRFIVRAGSALGRSLLSEVRHRQASPGELEEREAILARSRARITRTLDAQRAPRLLAENLEHGRWDDVAERCLACGNCTLVCPTCFCAAFEQRTDLSGEIEMSRRWDSCFSLDHSYLHGGVVRESTRSRYRQWLTHKISTWVDQFGTSGCVGCGRCITWCPVGIDLTEEIAAIGAGASAHDAATDKGATTWNR